LGPPPAPRRRRGRAPARRRPHRGHVLLRESGVRGTLAPPLRHRRGGRRAGGAEGEAPPTRPGDRAAVRGGARVSVDPQGVGVAALRRAAEAHGVPVIRRHVFLCADQTKPKCAPREETLVSWDYLKRRIDELKLEGVVGLYRTKANCLRICL